jgi:sialate O-acetylesterase
MNMKPSRVLSIIVAMLALLLVILSAPVAAAVELPPVLSSHMVLQCDIPVPIWGSAAPGEKIVVTFRAQRKEATADAQGKWLVRLDPLQAGGPDTLTIAGASTVKLDDVLVGEVWVGSGQSNMAHPVFLYKEKDPVLAELVATPQPTVRLIMSRSQGWQPAGAEDAAKFSAELLTFGIRLQQELNVPVGLILGAVGGTPSGRWISQEALDSDAACQAAIAQAATPQALAKAQNDYQRKLDNWNKRIEAIRSETSQRQGAKSAPEPRKPVPPAPPGQCAQGRIGDLYEAHIRPFIPYGIRGVLWDQGENGTGMTGVDQFTLMGALIAGWRKEWGQGAFPFLYVQKPSGGGTAFADNDPVTRLAEKLAPLPATPPGAGEGIARELHLRIMQHPNTAMIISTDLGSGLHPANKSGYGTRAARVAAGFVYGQQIEYCGPLYRSHQIDGDKIRIRFSHVGKGLAAGGGGTLEGFQIAGADRQWRWAKAVIESDAVVVSHSEISVPAAVRYAWASRSPWANLFNQDGLPAQTFRTDEW